MQKSLFSSLKIVAMMLATDNEVHPKEKAWFLAISKKHGATFAQRSQLQEFLSGKNAGNLQEILSDIVDDFDKHRLLKFVRMAMRQDGIVKNSEIQFFYKIQGALEGSLQSDYQQLAHSLLKRDNEIRAWKDLDRLGNVWSQKLHIFALSGHFYYLDAAVWASVFELVGRHKYKFLIVAAIAATILYWRK
jgi:hypothetical protein